VIFAVIAISLTLALIRQSAWIGRPVYAAAFGLTLIYLTWLVSEAPITFARSTPSGLVDRTLPPYALARAATGIAAAWSPLPWTRWTWWLAAPVTLFLAGIVLRGWAIRVLGRFYSHHVIRQRRHSVVTSGPYARLRHPAYAGMLGAHVGFVAFFPSVLSLTGIAMLTAAVIHRIRTEERLLMTLPGYPDYAARTPRLLPGIW
jgi:protein-S-isoprenylcysteine O-methyltransferase Ste14